MSNKYSQNDTPAGGLKNVSAQQRWEMFHRAIAFAKQSNFNALQDADISADVPKPPGQVLTIVK